MISHEANSIKKRKKPELVKILPVLFEDAQQAEFAFNIIKEAIFLLKIDDPRDNRFSIAFDIEDPSIHITINKKSFIGFDKSKNYTSCQIEIPLLSSLEGADNKYIYKSPDRAEYDPDINIYKMPLKYAIANKQEMVNNYRVVLSYILTKNKKPEILKTSDRKGDEEIAIRDIFIEAVNNKKELDDLLKIFIKDEVIQKEPEYSIEQCADNTNFDLESLKRWVRAIDRKGQVILYGPPGTGKTYIAEHLAKHLIGGDDGFKDIIQFHSAYAYEDFIQGIRPRSNEGNIEYPIVPGRFYEFCKKANSRHGRCVLIIDEINRADPSRVFGELMFLLERRGENIPLAGGERFCVPKNVRIIGTMNTADRSIALVDHAMRRRFAFIGLYPNFEVLLKYHKKAGTDFPIENLIKVLEQLNSQIGDKHYGVGISFFMNKELPKYIGDIWTMEIEPYLEEYYFAHPNNVDKFRWANVRSKIGI